MELAGSVGVKFTAAGATYPLGNDFADANIRIAPSLPPVAELEKAMRVLCCSIKLSAMKKIIAESV